MSNTKKTDCSVPDSTKERRMKMRATILDDLIDLVQQCPDRIISQRFCHSGFMNATALSEKDLIEPWLVQLKRVRQRMNTEGYGTEAGRMK